MAAASPRAAGRLGAGDQTMAERRVRVSSSSNRADAHGGRATTDLRLLDFMADPGERVRKSGRHLRRRIVLRLDESWMRSFGKLRWREVRIWRGGVTGRAPPAERLNSFESLRDVDRLV